jgi:hypothetical protein
MKIRRNQAIKETKIRGKQANKCEENPAKK